MARLARPWKVLVGCVLFAAVGTGIYALSPLILPARLDAGPMVQNVAADAASLVWYTTKASEDQLLVIIDGEETIWPAENEGTRHRVRLTGLAAGKSYAYQLAIDGEPGYEGAVATARSPGAAFEFLVFGDSGRGKPEQYRLAEDMARVGADFILHTGDVVYGAGERHKYNERFFAPYAHLLDRMPIWPSLGNHDAGEPNFGGDFMGVFDLPENGPPGLPVERNYWFDYADARFAIVDSTLDEAALAADVAPWLEAVLAEPSIRWRFVVLHHPPYTTGQYQPDQRLAATLLPVFDKLGVDAVFAGHDHNYQRTVPLYQGEPANDTRGTVYVVTGAGGASLYELQPAPQRPSYFAAADDTQYSFTHVRIEADRLLLRQIALGGAIIDTFEWSKPPASASSPASAPAAQP